MKIFIAFTLLITLAGCGNKRTTHQDQIEIRNESRQTPPVLPAGESVHLADPELLQSVKEMRSEALTSSQVVKNDINGIGVQVAKVMDKFQAFGGDLLRAQAEIKTELRADFKASVGDLSNNMAAQATAIAEVKNEMKALASANAALGFKVDQQAQTISAGRDSHTQTINFSKEMVEVIRSENRVQFYTILAFVLVMLAVVIVLTRSVAATHRELLLKLLEKEK